MKDGSFSIVMPIVNPSIVGNLEPSPTGCFSTSGSSLAPRIMACRSDCDEPVSDVRRTFCLLVVFDLVLTFLLWLLYTQIKGQTAFEAFDTEVVHFNIHYSLFDLVMLAAVRFVLLILAYGLFRLHNPWVVAVTTTISSGFLIAKVFVFAFTREDRDLPLLDYLLLVSSFIVSWAETWFLDFKVLPRELKERLVDLRRAADEASPLLYGQGRRRDLLSDGGQSSVPFYTPQAGSPENRSVVGDVLSNTETVSAEFLPSQLSVDQRKGLMERGQSAVVVVKSLLQRSGWKLEKQGKSGENVYSLNDRRFGKVFRIEGIINAPPYDLFADFFQRVKELPKWNPSVAHSEKVDVLDDHTDVCYVCVNDQAGGMVSGRDFLDVRCFEKVPTESGHSYIIASMACEHPKKPVLPEFVRAENGPNAWIIEPLPPGDDGKERCRFISILNTNLKGWIPQSIVDQTLSTILFDLIHSLQKKWSPRPTALA